MSVLVTGATGTVGSVVVPRLVAAGMDVRAFTRSPEKVTFAPGVTPFKGELLDADALRAAMDGVEAVFLLSPVVPDELNVTIPLSIFAARRRSRQSLTCPCSGSRKPRTSRTSRQSSPPSA
jgi:uncharacterized protein YbjT (DUF2867 family)